MDSGNKKTDLLKGLQVLDLADFKGDFCSKIFGDLGARVIKIKRPEGNNQGGKGTFKYDHAKLHKSLIYTYNNGNKQSITLDICGNEGRESFLRLVKDSDALVESFAPDYLEKIHMGPGALFKTNPRLILVSITGFGQTGPRKNYRSCDLISSSFGGQMFINGMPSERPLNIFGCQSFYSSSLYAALGLLLALRKRKKTNKGEHIDLSIQEAVAATLEHPMIRFFHDGTIATRQGSLHWNNGFFISPCKDGFILMTIFHQWETLIEWLDNEGKALDLNDEKWRDEEYRREHVGHVMELLADWTSGHTVNELFELAQLMRFPWAPVYSKEETLGSPQLDVRGFYKIIEHPVSGLELKCPDLPYKFFTQEKNIFDDSPLQDKTSRTIHAKHNNILRGIRVLDLTRVLAGPYTTRLMGDFGAEVIKIQTKKTSNGAESNDSPYFSHWNRNKLGITIDMEKKDARELFLKLVGICDVLVENFTPRVMSNWGLSYETLRKARPDLIMLSMSGMGQSGPWKDFTVFGPTIHSLSGITSLTSYDRRIPVGPGNSYADIIAGLYGALALLASIEYRESTGQGMFIDLSEYESMCTMIGPAIMDPSINHEEIIPIEILCEQLNAAPYGCYRCFGNDRWCTIAVFTEDEWKTLCRVMGNPIWAGRKEFASHKGRMENHELLNRNIEEWTSGKPPEEIVMLLQSEGVTAGTVQNAQDLSVDPQLKARRYFREIEYSLLDKRMTDTYPFRFGGDLEIPLKSSPTIGEHNNYVFGELLGLDEKTIAHYIELGIIA